MDLLLLACSATCQNGIKECDTTWHTQTPLWALFVHDDSQEGAGEGQRVERQIGGVCVLLRTEVLAVL